MTTPNVLAKKLKKIWPSIKKKFFFFSFYNLQEPVTLPRLRPHLLFPCNIAEYYPLWLCSPPDLRKKYRIRNFFFPLWFTIIHMTKLWKQRSALRNCNFGGSFRYLCHSNKSIDHQRYQAWCSYSHSQDLDFGSRRMLAQKYSEVLLWLYPWANILRLVFCIFELAGLGVWKPGFSTSSLFGDI